MQNFDIVIEPQPLDNTFRVSKIMADFDVKLEHSGEHFSGNIDLSKNWNVGAIVGPSGSGKSTIAKKLFNKELITGFKYTARSVIDDMPKQCRIDDIIKIFYMVGFSSVPCWLKPYNVLSNGEKSRVDLARAILENEFIVYDEFTSVVDRTVAQTMSLSIGKTIKKLNRKFIAISCHYDILEWLQPDWVFDTSKMEFFFIQKNDQKKNLLLENAEELNGKILGVITI